MLNRRNPNLFTVCNIFSIVTVPNVKCTNWTYFTFPYKLNGTAQFCYLYGLARVLTMLVTSACIATKKSPLSCLKIQDFRNCIHLAVYCVHTLLNRSQFSKCKPKIMQCDSHYVQEWCTEYSVWWYFTKNSPPPSNTIKVIIWQNNRILTCDLPGDLTTRSNSFQFHLFFSCHITPHLTNWNVNLRRTFVFITLAHIRSWSILTVKFFYNIKRNINSCKMNYNGWYEVIHFTNNKTH